VNKMAKPKCPYCGGNLEPYQDSDSELMCEDCSKIVDKEEALK